MRLNSKFFSMHLLGTGTAYETITILKKINFLFLMSKLSHIWDNNIFAVVFILQYKGIRITSMLLSTIRLLSKAQDFFAVH